jgi:hypothetical protein
MPDAEQDEGINVGPAANSLIDGHTHKQNRCSPGAVSPVGQALRRTDLHCVFATLHPKPKS